jgi:hypothetical protein
MMTLLHTFSTHLPGKTRRKHDRTPFTAGKTVNANLALADSPPESFLLMRE